MQLLRLSAIPLLLLAGLLGLAQAGGPPDPITNTDEHVFLRVTTVDGQVHQGEVEFKKTYLSVRGGRRVKLKYHEISSLADPPWPPTEAELDKARTQHTRRAERTAPEDVAAWVRLGQWAREQGLDEEAEADYRHALELDPDQAQARKALGHVLEGKTWVPGGEVVARRLQALKPEDTAGQLELARYALDNGVNDEAFRILHDLLKADNFNADALRLMRPLSGAYRAQVQLRLPVQGRWQVSPDSTRHHGMKSFAVYALDLYQVDADGKAHRGAGRKLEDYYCWEQPFYAMAPGRVVEVRNDEPDNEPFKFEGRAEKHNGVSIDHGNGEISWYIHAKLGSVSVKVGDEVKAGQQLGLVGNSGGSATPHLHVTLVAFHRLSVPWACEDYRVLAPDGTPLRVTRACPRESWLIEGDPPREQ